MNRGQIAASVAASKEKRPSEYCPVKNCLWYTKGGYCPRHKHLEPATAKINQESKQP